MERSFVTDMAAILAAVRPESLLGLGEGAARAFAPYRDERPEAAVCLLRDDYAGGLDRLARRFELACAAGVLECLPKREAVALLARLRDQIARRLYVLVPLNSDWPQTELLALGLSRVQAYRNYALYRFDLYDYKTTPDWFNPKYWAHPERWDRERW